MRLTDRGAERLGIVPAMSLAEPARPLVDAAIGSVCTACVALVEREGRRDVYAAGSLQPDGGDDARCVVDTLFDLASLTKLATTALVLTLVRDGDVRLDAPFRELWPDFRDERPTLRQVLTHSAGLAWWRHFYQEANGVDAIVALAASEELAYPPGIGYAYSDLGYIMLTAALARIGEAPFARLVAERVLRPLGIGEDELRYLPSDRRRCAATELDSAWRRRRLRGEVDDENAFAMGGIAGHAGLFGTAEAVATLMRVFARGDLIGADLLKEARREQAQGPNARRGLGLALRAPAGPMCGERFSLASFGHLGFTGTSAWYDPEKDLLVVLLTNAVYYGRQEHGLYPFRIAVHEALS